MGKILFSLSVNSNGMMFSASKVETLISDWITCTRSKENMQCIRTTYCNKNCICNFTFFPNLRENRFLSTFRSRPITHDIYQSLAQGYEVRGVFLDISETFDKVWHKGLIHKLEKIAIGGPLLKILTYFLKSWNQRVDLNG